MRGQWIHKNGHVPPSLRAVGYALSQFGLDQFQPSKLEVSSAGKIIYFYGPSIPWLCNK